MAELQRTLSFPVVLIMTVTSIMGTGVFILPSLGAKVAGSWSIASWLILIAISMLLAGVFAELVGMFPKSGGVYEYTKQAFGPFASFLVGWLAFIGSNITVALLMTSAISYLGGGLPMWALLSISIAFILLLNYLAYRGVETSAMTVVVIGGVTIAALIALTLLGLPHFSIATFAAGSATQGPVPVAILLGVFLLCETFFGWENATCLAEEAQDPERTMPRAILWGTAAIAAIVLLFTIVTLGNIPAAQFGAAQAPISLVVERYLGAGAVPVASLIVYLSLIGTIAAWVISSPRMMMSIAQDKLLPQQLAEVHPVRQTPHRAILLQSIITVLFVLIYSFGHETLLGMLIPLDLSVYTVVLLGFIKLRRTRPEQPRPFRLPAGVAIAIGLLLFLAGLVLTWAFTTGDAFALLRACAEFIILGVALFFLVTVYYNPDASDALTTFFARLQLALDGLFMPHSLRRELTTMYPLKGKRILDFGAGIGSLTIALSERAGPHGTVTATEKNHALLRLLEEKLRRKRLTNVTLIHDPHQINRVHPSVGEVDAIFGVDELGAVQDLGKVVRELSHKLAFGGSVCFVEYTDYFGILPNPTNLADEERLLRSFRSVGIIASAQRRRGLFWNFLIVTGQKRSAEICGRAIYLKC